MPKTTHNTSVLPKWAQHDIEDMMDSRQTSSVRCRKCRRLHDEGLVCLNCERREELTHGR